MHILHLGAGNLYGGIERLLATLAQQADLCPNLHASYGLCFEGRLTEELRAAGADVRPLGGVRFSRPWTVMQARRRLDNLLSRETFDAVICHACWPHALFASVVRARRLPLIFWAHAIHAGRHWLERWARRTLPDLVLANSRATASALGNLFPGVPHKVIYLPVAPPDLVDRDRIRREVRSALQTDAKATVVLQLSRLEPLKGHVVLLQALDRLRDSPDWVCWVAGSVQRPQETAYLRSLQASPAYLRIADRVRILDHRFGASHLLAAADLFCQPNTEPESFGIAFIEALYSEVPVVTSAIGGALEIVDATCGVLTQPRETDALAETLRLLIQDKTLRQSLGAAGPARARMLCDPTARLEQLRTALNEVLCRQTAMVCSASAPCAIGYGGF
jgi:glycosyltransferase involved in cell wall biosynthesis